MWAVSPAMCLFIPSSHISFQGIPVSASQQLSFDRTEISEKRRGRPCGGCTCVAENCYIYRVQMWETAKSCSFMWCALQHQTINLIRFHLSGIVWHKNKTTLEVTPMVHVSAVYWVKLIALIIVNYSLRRAKMAANWSAAQRICTGRTNTRCFHKVGMKTST